MAANGTGRRPAWRIAATAWLSATAEPLMAAVLVLYLLYQFLLSHVEGDQAYLLYAAQQVLSGVQLDGPRLIETNPPLIVWFSAVPAALARLLHLDAILALRVVVLCLLAGSAAWGWRLLRLAKIAASFRKRAVRGLWAATFLLITLTQPAEFGQREQLLLALFLPYLLAVGTDAVDRLSMAERAALGVCAGLAVCFKPQHLLTLLFLQGFLLLYRRTARRLLSTEMVAAVATGLLYVDAVRLFTPAYLAVMVPLLRSTYWALGGYTLQTMALHVGLSLTLAASGAGAAWYLLRRRLMLPQLEGAMVASGAGALLAYFQQGTGWYHQRYTAVALLEMGAVWMVVDLLQVRGGPDRVGDWSELPTLVSRVAWIALPLAACLLFGVVHARKHRTVPAETNLAGELAKLPPGTTVYAFSVGMNAFPAVVEHHLLWGSRFAHLWMLPAIRANEVPAAHHGRSFKALTKDRVVELATLQRSETTEDLLRTAPAMVFVERCAEHHCECYTSPFDAVRWFSQDPAFAQLWQDYHHVRQLPDYDVYQRNR